MISIILPTYNRPHQLKDALASIRRQTGELVSEVLIGDDSQVENATKNIEVIRDSGLEYLVRYVHNSPPRGNYPNQWHLAGLAKQDYILILHDDDMLCDGALDSLMAVAKAEQNEMVGLWFGRNLVMDDEGNVLSDRSSTDMEKYGKSGVSAVRHMWEWSIRQAIPPNGFLIKRRLYLKYMKGERDGNVGDFWLSIRMANANILARFVSEDVSLYRVQENSNTSRGRGVDVHLMFEAARALIVPPTFSDDRVQLMRKFSRVAVYRYLRDGERLNAARCYFSIGLGWGDRLSVRGFLALLLFVLPTPTWRWLLKNK